MKKNILLVIVLTSFLLSATAVFGEPIELKLERSNITMKMGDEVNTILKVASSLNFTLQRIALYSEPALHNEWLSFDKPKFNLTQNISKQNATLTVFASNDIGRYTFSIVAENEDAPDVRSVAKLNVLVIPPDKFLVTDFSANMVGSEIKFNLELRNVDTQTATLLVELLDQKGSVIKSANITKDIDNRGSISDSVDMSNLLAGNYTLAIKIAGTNHMRTKTFEISKLQNINQTKSVTKTSFISEDIIVYITNKGNKDETDIKIYEEAPKSSIVTLFSQGKKTGEMGDNAIYEFTIPKLKPGETISISYRIENWLIIIEIAVAVIVIVILLTLFIVRSSKPFIRKKVIKRGTHSFTVILEVKAPKTRGLLDVKIRDWVPAFGKIHESHEALKPTVRESYNGTEILWSAGDVKAGDHRIFSYSVAATVPTMRLPQAYMDFLSGKKRSRLYSNAEVVQ